MTFKELIVREGGVRAVADKLGYTTQYVHLLKTGKTLPGGILQVLKKVYPELDMNSFFEMEQGK